MNSKELYTPSKTTLSKTSNNIQDLGLPSIGFELSKPIIALTAGIASGKSTVAKIFQDIGNCFVINADDIYHELIKPGNKLYFQLLDTFGVDILNFRDLELDVNLDDQYKKKLAFEKLPPIDRDNFRKLFFDGDDSSTSNLEKLESITHKAILQKSFELFKQAQANLAVKYIL